MVGEAPGPVNFTQMVILFAEKMAGGKSVFIFMKIKPIKPFLSNLASFRFLIFYVKLKRLLHMKKNELAIKQPCFTA
jgi:hypothetical protein